MLLFAMFCSVAVSACSHAHLQLPPAGHAQWETGLWCNCMADGFGNCLKSTWLPFVTHADNAEQAARKTNPSAPSCFSKELVMWVVASAFGAGAMVQLPVRRQVREMYGISEEESCCNSDIMTSCCCALCDMVQVGVQLKKPLPDLRR